MAVSWVVLRDSDGKVMVVILQVVSQFVLPLASFLFMSFLLALSFSFFHAPAFSRLRIAIKE